VTIPEGFLLYEKQAANDPTHWQRHERMLPVRLCPGTPAGQDPKALDGRTLVYDEGEPGPAPYEPINAEAVGVYATESQAAQVLDRVRAEARRCARYTENGNTVRVTHKPVAIGDAAVRVEEYFGGDSSEVTIWVRRGAAVATYTSEKPVNGSQPPAERDARTMANKMCRYDTDC